MLAAVDADKVASPPIRRNSNGSPRPRLRPSNIRLQPKMHALRVARITAFRPYFYFSQSMQPNKGTAFSFQLFQSCEGDACL